MSNILVHAVRVVHAVIRESAKNLTRSPHWPAVRRKFLNDNSRCAACGSRQLLQVHHMIPFSDRPDLELDPRNLITLCMSHNECHLHIGHGGGYTFYNPEVVVHVSLVRQGMKKIRDVWAMALSARRDKP